jgi:hypothetical protein
MYTLTPSLFFSFFFFFLFFFVFELIEANSCPVKTGHPRRQLVKRMPPADATILTRAFMVAKTPSALLSLPF